LLWHPVTPEAAGSSPVHPPAASPGGDVLPSPERGPPPLRPKGRPHRRALGR
jgi:hypothetical protein